MPNERKMPDPVEHTEDEEATFFRQLVREVRDFAIYRLTPEGRIASWNQGAERVLGYRAEEVIDRPYSIFFTEAERAAGKPEKLLRLAATDGRTEDEGWRIQGDGSRIWANGVVTSLHGPNGEITGFAKITR